MVLNTVYKLDCLVALFGGGIRPARQVAVSECSFAAVNLDGRLGTARLSPGSTKN